MRGTYVETCCLLYRASDRHRHRNDRSFSGLIRGGAVVDGRRRGRQGYKPRMGLALVAVVENVGVTLADWISPMR